MKEPRRVLVCALLCSLLAVSAAASDAGSAPSRSLGDVLSDLAAKSIPVNRIIDSASILGLDLTLGVCSVDTRKSCGRTLCRIRLANRDFLEIDADSGTLVSFCGYKTNGPGRDGLRYEVYPYGEAAAHATEILAALGVDEDISHAKIREAHEGVYLGKQWGFWIRHLENGVCCGSVSVEISGDTGGLISYSNSIVLPPKGLKEKVTGREAVETALEYVGQNGLRLLSEQIINVSLSYGPKQSEASDADRYPESIEEAEKAAETMHRRLYWVVLFERDEDDRVAICVDALTGKVLSAD